MFVIHAGTWEPARRLTRFANRGPSVVHFVLVLCSLYRFIVLQLVLLFSIAVRL